MTSCDFHFDMTVRDLMANGMTPDDARRGSAATVRRRPAHARTLADRSIASRARQRAARRVVERIRAGSSLCAFAAFGSSRGSPSRSLRRSDSASARTRRCSASSTGCCSVRRPFSSRPTRATRLYLVRTYRRQGEHAERLSAIVDFSISARNDVVRRDDAVLRAEHGGRRLATRRERCASASARPTCGRCSTSSR